jgi:16S rRNA (cytosine1402-N4)-methyltransferase
LFEYGEESRGRRIAAEIAQRRARKPLATTEDLVWMRCAGDADANPPGEIHPATKTFPAVRIAVNRELEVLERGLRAAAARLAPGGRLAVISYHSLEDRIVKNIFGELSGKRIGSDLPDIAPPLAPILANLSKKPIVPTDEEIRRNPRARSAKLRIAERLPPGAEE